MFSPTATRSVRVPLLRSYMPELDVVRGIAILLVLFYHGVAPPLNATLSSAGKLFFHLSQYGWVGVNLFFVLSGFLITGILIDSRNRAGYFRRFYLRRALRILPALCATLLILKFGGWISWRFLALAAVFLANCAPFFRVALEYPPLWSLAVEEHFYLLWPGLVRRFSPASLALLLAVIGLLTPALRTLGFMFAGYRADYVPLYSWFNLDGIALGALVAIWLRQPSFKRSHLKRTAPLMLAGGAVAFALVAAQRTTEVALSATACNVASAGLLACMLLLGTSPWARAVNRPVLKSFGYISYGLYLIHVLAFRLAEIILSHAGWLSSTKPEVTMLLRLVVGCALATLVAYLSRRSLEERFLQLGSHSAPRASAVSPAVAEL